MTGKMLATGGHASLSQALDQSTGQCDDGLRIRMEGTVADDAATTPVEIKHRRKGKIDATGAQFGSEHVTDVFGGFQRRWCITIPQFTKTTHRRQACKAFAAALYPAPFVINGNQERRGTQGMDFGSQRAQLRWRLVVAGKQDQTAHQRVTEPFAFQIGQFVTCDIDHQRAGGQSHGHDLCSRMTKATAYSASSLMERWATSPRSFR